MDLIEKLNQKFGGWYESLFGENGDAELRPKDVLRKILHAMDDNRSEGIDGKVYVPNKYILVLNLADPDERDYLLSFLDEEELAAVLVRYMAQNGYSARGPLDFTIIDVGADEADRSPRLTVKARFERGNAETAAPAPEVVAERVASRQEADNELPVIVSPEEDDFATIYSLPQAFAQLAVTEPNGRHSLVTITGPSFTIGRSRSAGNDLVLPSDGKVSKRHARIDLEPSGKATLYDLESTNGVTVNGKRIFPRALLQPLDHIVIGDTLLVFDQIQSDTSSTGQTVAVNRKIALLSALDGGVDHVLASDNLIGQSITSDIVLTDSASSIKQARVIAHESGTFTIEDLAGNRSTLVNDRVVSPGERIKLTNGDRVQLGATLYQYLDKA